MHSSIHIHGVSVGEILSASSLIERLRADLPDVPLLLTCWTPTSLALAEKNYGHDPLVTITKLPLDVPWNNRNAFINKYNIKVSLWIDSEIWPGWLAAMKKRGIATMIINGRMSQKTYDTWRKVKWYAKKVLSHYARIDAQSKQDARFFNELGGKATVQSVNLKYLRPLLPVNAETLAKFKTDRPVIFQALTHPGDETRAFLLHKDLKVDYPDLLTINVPRHPHRASELAIEAQALGLKTQLRSESDDILPDTDIFFGDTMGEMGFYYALSPIAIIGKSFDPDHVGGQSPIEAAQTGCAILCGPYMTNFPAIMEDLIDADAITVVADQEALRATIKQWLQNPDEIKRLGQNAKAMCLQKIENGPSYLASVVEFIKDRI